MSIVKYPPHTIHLGGDIIETVGTAGVAITPGMLIETYTSGLRPHSFVEGAPVPVLVALDRPMPYPNLDDAYPIGEPVRAAVPQAGATFYMRLAIDTAALAGEKLESVGDGTGTLRPLTTGKALFSSLDNKDAAGVTQMIRVECL